MSIRIHTSRTVSMLSVTVSTCSDMELSVMDENDDARDGRRWYVLQAYSFYNYNLINALRVKENIIIADRCAFLLLASIFSCWRETEVRSVDIEPLQENTFLEISMIHESFVANWKLVLFP